MGVRHEGGRKPRFGRMSAVTILGCCLVLVGSRLKAQETVPPPPGSDYTASRDYGGALPSNPVPGISSDGSSFAIPIPGGGGVQVNGPASEPLPPQLPLENWATLRTNPYTVGGTPIGPGPRP